MPLTIAQLHALVNQNLADNSNIIPSEHRQVENEIINTLEQALTISNPIKFSGRITYDIGSADPFSSSNYTFVDELGVPAIFTVTKQIGTPVRTTFFNVTMPSLFANIAKYIVCVYPHVNNTANLDLANDIYPIVINKKTTTTFDLITQELSNITQSYDFNIEIKQVLY
jgi:hypothetical protein